MKCVTGQRATGFAEAVSQREGMSEKLSGCKAKDGTADDALLTAAGKGEEGKKGKGKRDM